MRRDRTSPRMQRGGRSDGDAVYSKFRREVFAKPERAPAEPLTVGMKRADDSLYIISYGGRNR